MNTKEIKEVMELMREHGLSEVELEKEGMKLKLKKTVSGQVIHEAVHSLPSISAPAAPSAPAPEAAQAGPPAGTTHVCSPMVGTFYAAPAPDQPPYVSIGQAVKEGDVLCIVEAMKLMNEIKSDVAGVIDAVLVKNGEPVEFDQPLFRIKTQ